MTHMPVRLGIVGAGGFTRRFHIPNFVQIPGVQVVAVCNRSVDSGKTVAEEFGFDHRCICVLVDKGVCG